MAEGADANEQLRHAARSDNVELFQTALAQAGVDVNAVDGLGNTALHLAAQCASTSVLPELLEQEVDVDLQNNIARDTPLHLAVKVADVDEREWCVQQLVEAGADPRVVNKEGDKPADCIVEASSEAGTKLRQLLREAEGAMNIGGGDIANDDDDEEDDGPPSDEE